MKSGDSGTTPRPADSLGDPAPGAELTVCAECGTKIPESTLGLMCPRCLLGGLWEEHETADSGRFTVQGYEVGHELGRGGMGIVYLAQQLDPAREVAMKMLLPMHGVSKENRERFQLEAATVAALDHPHILPVYATGEHDGLPWFTLKLARGGSLAERMSGYAGRWREAAELLVTLAEAVHFAHQRGVLHRDLKPGNVIFDEAGVAYVSDFGLAKWIRGDRSASHALTMDGRMMGTPHYLSPEAAKAGAAAATAASDVYGLGAIFYELLTGTPPFTAESTPELMRCIYEAPAVAPVRRNPEVPQDLSAVALKCLEKAPTQRYESAAALAADLRLWLAGRGVQARPVSGAVRLARWARRNPALAATAAALLAVLVTAGGLLMKSHQRMRAALAESLLSQARMTGMEAQAGTRDEVLHLLREADLNGAASSPSLAARRQTEIAHALALPELSQQDIWTAPSASSEGTESFSPDLQRYLAATLDGGFAMFESRRRQVLRAYPPAAAERAARTVSPAVRLRLSPAENLAAVICAGDSTAPAFIKMVSLSNGATIHEWPCTNASREWPVWLADGGFLFANQGTACVRADANGENITPFPDEPRAAAVIPLALAPDGLSVVVALKSGPALARISLMEGNEIWRTPLLALPGPVAWSADGNLLAVGERVAATRPDEANAASTDCGVILVDANDGKVRHELPGHARPVAEVAFLQGGKTIASVSSDQGLRWQESRPGGFQLTAPAQPRALQADRHGERLAWSPTHGSLCIAQSVLPSGWHPWPETAGPDVTCVGLSVDQNRLFLATKNDLQLWDTKSARRLDRLVWPSAFSKIWPWFVVSPDARQVILGDQGQPLHTVALDAVCSKLGPLQPQGPGREFYMIHSLAPNGAWVVCDGPAGRTVQRDRTFSLWPDGDYTRAKLVARDITASTMHVLGDGQWALAASRNGRDCSLWDTRDGRLVGMLGLDESVTLEASGNHQYAVLTGRAQTTLWSAQEQKIVVTWPSPPGVAGMLPKFSPDSRQLAMHDRANRIYLYEVPTGKLIITLAIPGGFNLWDVSWASPQRLVAVGADGRLGEWDLAETAAVADREGVGSAR